MRFRAHELGLVRCGKLTLCHFPYERKPLRFRAGHFYALRLITDVRVEQEDKILYQPKATTVPDEWVHVLSVRHRSLYSVPEVDARAAGYESLAEWRDSFECDFGEHARVWRVGFAYSLDMPRLLGKAEDYTSTSFMALPHEPEAVDSQTLERFGREARERKGSLLTAVSELPEVRAARERGIDVRSTVRLLERKLSQLAA